MSGGQVGRAHGYQSRGLEFKSQSGPKVFSPPLGPPSTKWVARSLGLGESKRR